jgi:tripartite-type tricarboxylate transporter receptor subunit TctC
VNTLQDLIALAKQKPGDIMFASSGQGSIIHAATELFKLKADINMTHVPYRGTGPALTDTLAGQTQVFFSSAATALQTRPIRQAEGVGRDQRQAVTGIAERS